MKTKQVIYTAQVSVFGVILVDIFLAFPRIRTEFGEIGSISPYSVRMRENEGKVRTRITPNTDSFYAVIQALNNGNHSE